MLEVRTPARRVLAGGGAGLALLAAAAWPSPQAPPARAATAAAQGPTTLDRTIVAKGERDLAYGGGEPRITRHLDWPHGRGGGRALAGFKHLSDVHVIDEESPARVEWMDACTVPELGTQDEADKGVTGAYRVHESLSTQVGDAMLRRLAAITRGPATNVPLSFAISTGDNADNNQVNETRWFVDLLDGEVVDPNSGARSYDGYTREQFADALDLETLELAQQPFDAIGTKIPWYAVLGNHDGLAQGNAPGFPFESIAVGGRKVFIAIEGYSNCPDGPDDLQGLQDIVTAALSNSSREVPADPARHFMTHDELVEQYFDTTGKPVGHGLARAPQDPMFGSRAGYYSFPIAPKIRGISLDTIAYAGGDDGHIPDPQFRWLEEELLKWSRVYLDPTGAHARNPGGKDRMIVLFSHHSSPKLANPGVDPAGAPYHCFRRTDQPECADGEGLDGLLKRFPNVIAWVNGHEHNNAVRRFPAAAGQDPDRGYWELNTAAHIDWPQQARLIEIAWKPGRGRRADTVFIYGTVVDHAAAPDPDRARQSPIAYLASLSRVEAYYDACVRTAQAKCIASGRPKDRNVKLVQKAPFDLGR
ncbi:MAG: hypothetical protein ABR575_08995 [Actinomycetota bacterium]